MKRGELNRRFDPTNHRPEVRALIRRINAADHVTLNSLTRLCYRYPTFYGFEYLDAGVLVLKGENITRDGDLVEVEEPSYISDEVHARFPRTHLEPDDLIVSVRGEVGKVGLVPERRAGSNINANTIRIALNERAKGDEFTPEFIWLYLNSNVGQAQIRQFIAGGVQETITAPELLEVRIPKLSIGTQAALVAGMQAARAERRAKVAEAEALLASFDGYLLDALRLTPPVVTHRQSYAVRFRQMAGTRIDAQFHQPHFAKFVAALVACPHAKESLGGLSTDIVGGATPTRGDRELYAQSGIRFLRILNVQPNQIVDEHMNFIQEHVHEGELKRSQLAANDVLMTITGRVGTAAVVSEEILPANINQHIVRLRLRRGACDPYYLAAYLNSSFGLALSNRGVTGGTRIALDYGAIRELLIPIPPPQLQSEIIAELHRRREAARCLRADAESGWEAAKRWFEEQLLGPVPSEPSVTVP